MTTKTQCNSNSSFQALDLLTVDDLTKLSRLLDTNERLSRKSDLIKLISQHLEGSSLQQLWEKLDMLQQCAVQETLYSEGLRFNSARFLAKYGASPNFSTESKPNNYAFSPSILQLFLYREGRYKSGAYHIPLVLAERLKTFIQKPEKTRLETCSQLPEYYEHVERSYELQKDDPGITVIHRSKVFLSATKQPKVTTHTTQIPITVCQTENAAQFELKAVLKLIEKNKISVSNKTFFASKATLKSITEILQPGDYYPWDPEKKGPDVIGPIKAHAWPILLQCAKLAEIKGSKLTLTKAGRTALVSSTEKTLQHIWKKWISNKLFDEFNRINHIKGQGGKGKRFMTQAIQRRNKIIEGMNQCPVNEWVDFDRFSRYLQASGKEFDIARDYWHFYIFDQEHGSLGYDGHHDWHVIQGRYLLCFLFEYAATLGLLDVAYIPPDQVTPDYHNIWGTDDLSFLSRYDGLCYFRLNPLGAYCLGLADNYNKRESDDATPLSVLPNRNIKIATGALTTEEALTLDIFAEKTSEDTWHLDNNKIISAVELGHSIDTLREFLKNRDNQPLPEAIEGLLQKCEKNAGALKLQGNGIIIQCASKSIAKAIGEHKETKSLCLRAGDKHLVVKSQDEKRFRDKVHILGFGIV